MAISEAQRQEIIDLTGSMSVRDIAEHVGVSKDAVYRVQKTVGGEPTVMTDEEYRDADAEIAKLSERLAHISEKEMGQ